MELEQLKQLIAVAQNGTLQRAAKQLHLSQSALSRSLRRLELDVGQDLFDRTHNSLVLNDAGRVALDHAHAMLAEEQRLYESLDAMARRTRTVRVASVAPAPTWRLSSLILEQQLTTILEPDLVTPEEVESRLLNQACDLAVCTWQPKLPTVRSFALMHEDLYANIPIAHPLHDRSELSFTDLDGESFLLYQQIGFWMDVHRRHMPHTTFVIQPDRTIFLQQISTSDLLTFTTNAPENTSGHPSRVAIPIIDEDAHVTYYLCMREEAPERMQALFELLERRIATEE